jgi:hypothetical protein
MRIKNTSVSLPLIDDFDAILASEFVGHTTRTRCGVLPVAINEEAILISPRLQGKGCSPYSVLILFHYACMEIPMIELPY